MTRILIVEDERSVRDKMATYLQEKGWEMGTASNGKEGLSLLQTSTYDLVVTDILMPGINGIELIRKIKKDYPNIKILACSEGGHSIAKEFVASILLNMSIRFGADDGIKKPFYREDFIDLIEEILGIREYD